MVPLSKKGNTQVVNGIAGGISIKFYNTFVVSFNDKQIIINTGGYNTVTTRQRINQTSNEYNLGFTVFQKKGNLFVKYKGETMEFFQSIELKRSV